jgi:hypothetical protein
LGGGPVNAINQGDDDGADGDFIEIDLFQPFDAEPDSNDEDEGEDDFVDSGSSGNDGYIASSDSSSGEGGGSDSDEWEDADDGHFPEAAPPAGQQPQAAAAAAAGQALGVAAPGPGAAAQPGQQLMQQAEAAMQALDAVAAQFQQQQQQGAEPGAAAQELQAVHQQAQAAVGAAAAALQQNFQDLQQELSAAAQQTAAAVMEPHMHFVGRLRGLGECRAAHCCVDWWRRVMYCGFWRGVQLYSGSWFGTLWLQQRPAVSDVVVPPHRDRTPSGTLPSRPRHDGLVVLHAASLAAKRLLVTWLRAPLLTRTAVSCKVGQIAAAAAVIPVLLLYYLLQCPSTLDAYAPEGPASCTSAR